jgi:dUTPase
MNTEKKMAYKIPKIKFIGTEPENGLLRAKIFNKNSEFVLEKINFNHRCSSIIETDLEIELEEDYKLCFSIVPELANRGMIATNAPGNFKKGKVYAHLINVGREIVEIKNGDPLMNIWIELEVFANWTKQKNTKK